MDKEQFKNEMLEIYNKYQHDPETAHSLMDSLMCQCLVDLGYGEGIEIFCDTESGIHERKV